MRMGVLFTATSVRGFGKRLRSAGVGGMTLTSQPLSMRNFVLVCVSLTKNRRLEVGRVGILIIILQFLFSSYFFQYLLLFFIAMYRLLNVFS